MWKRSWEVKSRKLEGTRSLDLKFPCALMQLIQLYVTCLHCGARGIPVQASGWAMKVKEPENTPDGSFLMRSRLSVR